MPDMPSSAPAAAGGGAPAPQTSTPAAGAAGSPSGTARAPASPAPAKKPVDAAAAREAEYQAAMEKVRGKKQPAVTPAATPQMAALELGADDDAGGEGAGEEEAPSAKTWKIKSDGVEEELDEAELVRRASLARGAEKRIERAAKVQKQAEQFLNALISNPIALLTSPQLAARIPNFRQQCEQWLYKQVHFESLPKDEQLRMKNDEELERFRNADRERIEDERRRKQEEGKEGLRQKLTQQFTEALKTGGLPATNWTILRMRDYMLAARNQGLKNVAPADVVKHVRRDFEDAMRHLYGSMDGDQLVQTLGKDVHDKIRRADVARVRAGTQPPPATRGAAPAPRAADAQPRFRSAEEMRDQAIADARRRR